ncbi:hypothetical protein FEM48_Zijuj07G0003500 [Ziziphus jujuba var. spinosa]|uniref:Uncharacterized protein n=1 Tax=Ziziphus jujuba var. spinosa TaxID=714518 RepID=A0A978V1C5_ZIZJJ|nr:hypothetical protein FEM48_Zijuj07G0003500 [Ziziphus jujuba var. spinosa]
MVLDQPELECNWNHRAFERMRNLRLLNLHCKMHLPDGLEYLPNNLRFLKWRGYPWKYFPPYFYPSKLVELNMCHSRIELLWRGEKVFGNLKFIKLSHSQQLRRTPNFCRGSKSGEISSCRM